jgi:DNA-binding CsgD family transcriptional regulator
MKEKMIEINAKYEAEKKDRQIQKLLLNKKIDKVKNRAFFIGIISFSIVIMLFISFLYTRQRNRSRVLQNKKKLLESEKVELDKELEFKKKQLSSHALHMTQKNKILQSIRMAIEDVMPMIPDENKLKVRELRRELNKSLRYDKDWELFSFYFNELNKNFFDKLTTINPKLSQHDIRLAALLKMKLNIKEAAAVLNIAPDSVKTARYKLRKKLNLRAEDDLVKFISNL